MITDTGIQQDIISLYEQQRRHKKTPYQKHLLYCDGFKTETQDEHLSLSLPSDSCGWYTNLKNHISAVTITYINQAHINKAKHL